MEDITSDQPIEQTEPNKCANCGSSWIEQGYPTPLCSDCRQRFIKFPIPGLIKLFGLAIVAIVLISMIRLPQNISLGIHKARGEKAFKNRQYQTAQDEFGSVLKTAPQYTSAKMNRAMSSFYLQDYKSLLSDLGELEGKEIENQGLYSQLVNISNQLTDYLPSDTFLTMQQASADSSGAIPVKKLQNFIAKKPDEVYALLALASSYFNTKEYTLADSILSGILKKDPGHLTALALMTTTKRELNQFDESIEYCDKLISLNKESIYGISSKARTFLKMQKDKEALKLALQAKEIKKDDPYNLATLALVYHFSNMMKQRDELISRAANDSTTSSYFEFVNDVITNKIKFR